MNKTEKAEGVIKSFNKLHSERENLLAEWDGIGKYVLPSHAYFQDQKVVDGNHDNMIDVYDTTAMRSNEVLAASIHGGLTPPNAKWFSYRIRDDEINSIKEVREWLEECEKLTLEAIQESNFVTSIAQVYLDLGAFNTAALTLDDESQDLAFGRLKFTNIHLSQVVFREGVSGKAEYVWIKQELMPAVALAMLPDDVDKMPKIKEYAEDDKKQFELFEFYWYCEPEMDDGRLTGNYVVSFVSKEDKSIVNESIDTAIGAMIPRWQQSTGQVWGTGPGLRALPDVLVINRAKELELGAWEDSLNRAYKTTPDNVIGDIDRQGLTICKDPGLLQNLNEGDYRWDVVNLKASDIQDAIRSMFYEDRLVMPTTSGDTATEFVKRYELLQRMLAPTMGKLSVELLNPIIERSFSLLMAGGKLPPMPESIPEGKDNVDIEYVSPLSKAQRLPEVDSVNRWLQTMLPLIEYYPNLRHLIDAVQIGRESADALDVPTKVIRGDREFKEAVQQEQQQQQELASAQAQQQENIS